MVFYDILFLIIGFVLLIKGSDYFVESSSRIAKKLGASEFLIGITLVAIGTSIPEISSSIAAAIKNDSSLIIGNVIGSNITNIGLILGIGAFMATIKVKKVMIKRDASIVIFSTIVFYLLAFNGEITIAEGILMLLIYIAYLTYLFSTSKVKKEYDFKGFLDYFMKFKYVTTIRKATIKKWFGKKKNKKIKKKEYLQKEGLLKDVLIIALSLIAIIYGAKFLVFEAEYFAKLFGVTTGIIGLTLVALGTSVPELGVAFRAAKKGYGDLVIGNVIGSNITNILLVIGITSIIKPIEIMKNTLYFTAPFMIGISILLLYLMKTKKKISKKEGIILLITYALFIILVLLIK